MLLRIGAAIAAVMLCGCATIVKSGSQEISIDSMPSQADFEIRKADSAHVVRTGKTPATVSLSRGDGYFDGAEYLVTLRKEGHADQTFDIQSHVNGWYMGGNFVFGGLLGWLAVDPATGAMWNLEPENISAGLVAAAPAPSIATAAASAMATTSAPVIATAVAPPLVAAGFRPGQRAVTARRTQFHQRTASGSLAAGAAVELISTRQDGAHTWWWVKSDEREGWVLAADLQPPPI